MAYKIFQDLIVEDTTATIGYKRYLFNEIPNEFLSSNRWRTILDNILQNLSQESTLQEELDVAYDTFCTNLFKEMDRYLGYKSCSKGSRKRFKHFKPYWNENLAVQWRCIKNVEKQYVENKNTSPNRINRARQLFKQARMNFDKLLRTTERYYYRKKALELEEINISNPKEFWDYIKRLGPKNKTTTPMGVYTDDGNITTDKFEVLNKWKNDFGQLLNPENQWENNDQFYEQVLHEKHKFETSMEQPDYVENPDINFEIKIDEVVRVINRLKNKKAGGPDQIPNEVLLTKKLNGFLTTFYSICFNYGLIPSIWQKAYIVPIPKSALKDPHVPLNYRGISLLSSVYKIYTSILCNRLASFCDANNMLVDEQNGFRCGRSCSDHLFTLSSIVRNRINQNQSTFAGFVDFRKAFDFINRNLLQYKIFKLFGIDGKMYKAIKSVNAHSQSAVRINNFYTEWFHINSGVRQGDTLSPLLFSLFINDLAKGIKDLEVGVKLSDDLQVSALLYADDVVLLSPDEQGLNLALQYVYEWCQKWRMVVNEDKTEVVHFRKKGKNVTEANFIYGNTRLNVNSKYKYLGLVLNENLDFQVTANVLAEAGGRALGAIKNKLKSLKDCGYNSFMNLYSTGVQPILNYGAGIWGFRNFNKHENIQRRALRYFLGVHRFSPNHAVDGDMGMVGTRISRHIEMIRLWNRLVTMSPTRLTKQVFLYDFYNCHGNWSEDFFMIMDEINMQNHFLSHSIVDIDMVKGLLYSSDYSKWNSDRFSKPKLRYYNMYKNSLEPEPYVLAELSKRKRSAIAQFRSGILPLSIETGRFRGVEINNRICPVCSQMVEDEFHFLMQCPAYQDLRATMFNRIACDHAYFAEMDDLEKFIFANINYQNLIGSYLLTAIDRRKQYIYDT